MTQLLVRYRVRPDAIEAHLALLHAVFGELVQTRPSGVRWESFQLGDGSFMDVVAVSHPGTFSRLHSWAAYRGTLEDRCDEPPTITELQVVDRYSDA